MSEKSDELPLEHLAYNICMENTEKYVRGISPFEKYEAKYIKIDDYWCIKKKILLNKNLF